MEWERRLRVLNRRRLWSGNRSTLYDKSIGECLAADRSLGEWMTGDRSIGQVMCQRSNNAML